MLFWQYSYEKIKLEGNICKYKGYKEKPTKNREDLVTKFKCKEKNKI